MNVYDWDKTIYDGDSTFDFVCYLYLHHPKTLLNLPRTLICGAMYRLGLMEKQQFKENMFRMFKYVGDMRLATASFASGRLKKVKRWYMDQMESKDIIISASPEFLVDTFGAYMRSLRMAPKNLTVVGSPVDMNTGKYEGRNCDGKEKVRIFKLRWVDRKIDNFYSDSLQDTPLAQEAERAYLIKGTKVTPWPKNS